MHAYHEIISKVNRSAYKLVTGTRLTVLFEKNAYEKILDEVLSDEDELAGPAVNEYSGAFIKKVLGNESAVSSDCKK